MPREAAIHLKAGIGITVMKRSLRAEIGWFAICVLLGMVSVARAQDNCAASTSTESTCSKPHESIPSEERQALIALYNATGGPEWKDNSGWLGGPGTECEWHGVDCVHAEQQGAGLTVNAISLGQNKLVGTIPPELGRLTNLSSLDLLENNLTGAIPSELGQLTKLETLILLGNHFTGRLPQPPIDRWLEGPLWMVADLPLVTDISKIDYEFVPTSTLCPRWRITLDSAGPAIIYTKRCRDATPRDRTTYCEVKEGEILWFEFARLAWTIEKAGFYRLQPEYNRSITHGAFANTRVTRDGKVTEVSDYAESGPLQLWTMERAIEGVAADIEVKKTTRVAKCPSW